MKHYRNIVISTFFVTVIPFAVVLVFCRIVIAFDDRAFAYLAMYGSMVAALSFFISLLIHHFDLKFATKYLKIPREERFQSGEEWLEVDNKLAIYPRTQATGTLFIWTAGAGLIVVTAIYFDYLSIRDSIFILIGGVSVGIIAAGYNFFFFKLHLAKLRRELAPREIPDGWTPHGSIGGILSTVFFSLLIALAVLPLVVMFARLHNLYIDAARQRGENALRYLDDELSRKITPGMKSLPKELNDTIIRATLDLDGELVLFNSEGKMLYGSDFEITGDNWKVMLGKPGGFISDINTGNYIVFSNIGYSGVKGAVIFTRSYFVDYALESLGVLGVIMTLALLITGGYMLLIRKYFGDSIKRLATEVEAVSAGDFDRYIPVSSDGEIGALEFNLSRMKNKLVDLIETQQDLVTRVTYTVQQLGAATIELREIAEEQAAGAAEQASAAQEAGVTAEEVKKSSDVVAERIESVSQMTMATLKSVSDGADAARATVAGIENIDYRVKLIADKMLVLGEHVQQIGKIADTIEEIGQRIHLLSINAGIEAVAAGEAGDRFTVVASEIRRFANSTADSAANVRAQVEEVRKAAAESVIFTEEGTKAVRQGLDKVESMTGAFKTMEESAEATSRNAQEIRMSVRQQNSASDQMAQTMQELNDMAMQVAGGATKIEHAITELDRLAESLKEMVASRQDEEDSPYENEIHSEDSPET